MALTPTQVTEVFLLTIGCEAVFNEIGATAVKTSDDFGNHMVTLTNHSIIRVWHTTLSGISVRKIAGVTDALSKLRVGKDAVSRIAARLEEQQKEWRGRSLEE